VHFEIAHELDAPLDAIERAVMSPELGPMLASSLTSIESVETTLHELSDGELRRVLRFQASAPLAIFKSYPVAHDAMSWEERWTYRIADHTSTWTVLTKDEWRRYFQSQGTYTLQAAPGGRTRRVVRGELEIKLPVIGRVVERMALVEVQKTYDAEADTLRRLATL